MPQLNKYVNVINIKADQLIDDYYKFFNIRSYNVRKEAIAPPLQPVPIAFINDMGIMQHHVIDSINDCIIYNIDNSNNNKTSK